MINSGIFYFTFAALIFGVIPPVQAANQVCLNASNYGEVFNLKGELNHDARLIADQIDERKLRLDIQRLSGRIGLECATGPCIADRYTFANKQAMHRFFVDRIQSLGLTPKFEQFGSRYSGTGLPSVIDIDNLSSEDRHRILSSTAWYIYVSFISDHMNERVDNGNWADFFQIEKLEKALAIFKELPKDHSFRRASYSSMHAELEGILAAVRAGKNIQAPISDEPEHQKIREVFPAYDPSKNTNITVTISGTEKADEVFEIVAHYDTVSRYVGGADDNGSGLATALEMIRLFTVNPPKKTLRFVFTDMEEQNGEGADHHLKTIEDWDEEFLGAFVIDMYGYAQLGPNPQFVLEVGQRRDYDSDESFASGVRLAEAFAFQYNRYRGRTANYTNLVEEARGDTGDHGSYWEADFPAIFIAQPVDRPNPASHSQADRIENMNWGFFTEVARLITETTALVSGAVLKVDRAPSVERLRYIDGLHNPDVSPEQVRVVEERSDDRSRSSRSSSSGSSNWGLFEFEDYLKSGKPIDFGNLNYTQSSLIIATLHFRELKKYLQVSGFQVDDMFLRKRMNREFLEYHRDKLVKDANVLSDAGVAPNLTINDIDYWLARIKGPGQASSSSRTANTEHGIANDIKEGKKLISATLSDRDLDFVAYTEEWHAFGLYVRNQGTFDSNEWIRRNLNPESLSQWKNQVKNDEKISYEFEAEVLESLEFWLARVASEPAQSTTPAVASTWTSVGTTGMPENSHEFVRYLETNEPIYFSTLNKDQAYFIFLHKRFLILRGELNLHTVNDWNKICRSLKPADLLAIKSNSSGRSPQLTEQINSDVDYWLARMPPSAADAVEAVPPLSIEVMRGDVFSPIAAEVVPSANDVDLDGDEYIEYAELSDAQALALINHSAFGHLKKYLEARGFTVDPQLIQKRMNERNLSALKLEVWAKISNPNGASVGEVAEYAHVYHDIQHWLRRAEPKPSNGLNENLTVVSRSSPEPEPPQVVVSVLSPVQQFANRINLGVKLDPSSFTNEELSAVASHVHFYFLSKYLRGKGVTVDSEYIRTQMTPENLKKLRQEIVQEVGEGETLPVELEYATYNVDFWLRRLE